MKNQEVINNFFDCYIKRDFDGVKQVMSENVVWHFIGQHKLAGVKNGIKEVITFFDVMGKIMGKSNPVVKKLIVAENDNYVIECQHIKTNRQDGINIDHHICVLWTFENERILSGRHFFADPNAINTFFTAVATS